MRNYLFLLVLGLATFFGCEPSGPATTALGNRYTVHRDGEGDKVAATNDFVYVHATMRTADSLIFDTRDAGGEATAIQVPADTLGADRVGPVEDVMRGRRAGDSLTVIVRIDTLEFKPPGMEDVDEIYYDLLITDVVSIDDFNARRAADQAKAQAEMEAVIAREPEIRAFAQGVQQQYASGSLENIQTTASGLQYVIHEEGDGMQAKAGDVVTVQYLGMLAENGNIFDQSFDKGAGITFPLGAGRVIPGWDEGLSLLKVGSKATLLIPSALGYGDTGTPDGAIPPASDLLFYVELEAAK